MPGNAAGVIIEPIQASAGQIPCPREYLQEVRAICDEFQVPLIFDEIQTFGRIGRWTAAEYNDVIPDVIVLGKGLGGGMPIAAIAVRDGLEGFSPEVEELHTFANSSLSQATSLKMLEIIERDNLLARVRDLEAFFRAGLEELQKEFPEIGDIRAIGLHIGIEFVADPQSKRPLPAETVAIREEGIREGVFFGLGGVRKNVLKIKPPFIINDQEAQQVLDILRTCMTRVLRK
jgi:4-aminobutyrate aminotransferase-like enzyme